MTTKQMLEQFNERMKFLEKAFVQLESKTIYNNAKENVKGKEVEMLGAATSDISLEDIKATVKVLEHYKKQGYKLINL
jgi:hypothetical protein